MYGGLCITERRLILEVGGLVAVGISAVGLGRLWMRSRKLNAEHRQHLIGRLFGDPGSGIRAQTRLPLTKSEQTNSEEAFAAWVRAAAVR
jgi:hypothetical protein